jgi:hypothetical protein
LLGWFAWVAREHYFSGDGGYWLVSVLDSSILDAAVVGASQKMDSGSIALSGVVAGLTARRSFLQFACDSLDCVCCRFRPCVAV